MKVDQEEKEEKEGERRVKLTWTIKNFSKLNCQHLYSSKFFTGCYSWKILINPKAANNGEGLSILLSAEENTSNNNLPIDWNIDTKLKLSLVNQIDGKRSITYGTINHQFKATALTFDYLFMTSAKFLDPSKGFLVNDTCKIVAEVFVENIGHDQNQYYSARDMSSSTLSCREFVDFKEGQCKIEKDVVQLLEQVFLKHPQLIECHRNRNRSQRFIEWSFIALGKVLHFLKTKKVKDMINDDGDACKELKNLWEELESFGFDDLSWLEDHVQSALGMKGYKERALQVKKLKKNGVDLEGVIKGMKSKMDAVDANLEIAKKELVKAQEGFVERELDYDHELGYGIL